jgi:hypothetical protein
MRRWKRIARKIRRTRQTTRRERGEGREEI